MREIKFRARHIKTSKWWYGSSEVPYESPLTGEHVYPLWVFWRYIAQGILDRKTVGQYTGLKDKNGKEIYEGDIVKIVHIFQVVFNEHGFWEAKNEYSHFPITRYPQQSWTIIGNIYENPELLESE